MENIIVNCRECPDCCAFLEEKDYEWCSCYNFFKEYNTDTSAGHLNNKLYEREKIHNSK